MAVGILWYAQFAKAHLANAVSTVATTSPMFAQLATGTGTSTGANLLNWTGRVSDLTIRGASRDITAVNTFGISQLSQPGRPEVVTAEFTLIYDGDTSAQYLAGSSITYSYTGTAANTGTFSRFQYGEKSTVATDRVLLCGVFTLDNQATGTSNKTVYVSLNNASLTNRELSLTSDGYVQEKWTLKCLAQDFYEEDNYSGGAVI